MVIKHLVFSGGGPVGLISYGAAKQLNKKKFWEIENIETIYGTSVGAYIGTLISLGYDWDWIDDYFIKRPWRKIIDIEIITLLEAYNKKGLLGEKFINDIILPLLEAKGLSKDVTFKELYEFNKIEIHIYSTEINGEHMKKIDISYITHPDMKVITGLCMSMAFPFIFSPVIDSEQCYIDGGVLNNFPLNDCLEKNYDSDEILGFDIRFPEQENKIFEESTIINYLVILLKKMKKEIELNNIKREMKNIVNCQVNNFLGFKAWIDLLEDEKLRREIIEDGCKIADDFLISLE
ncbi:MAG: hypothetical protein CMD14_04055 [Flavobacteriales bacterium]|nr:hypothetical protein [Flavobacteriales bacterium]